MSIFNTLIGKIALFSFMTVIWANPASAQVDRVCPDKSRQIGMVTGTAKGTYKKFGENIRDVLKVNGSVRDFEVCVKLSDGSLSNVKRMASSENAGIGIVQSDVIEVLKNSNILKAGRDVKELRLIAPLYNEEVHLFANKSIRSIRDLAGKRVNVGSVGGGSWVTATALFQALGLSANERPIFESLDHEDARDAVLEGRLDAMFFVAGKPVELFAKLNNYSNKANLRNVHFVPIDQNEFSSLPYFSSNITPADYRWMPSAVRTLSVKALLVAYDFSRARNSYFNTRCDQFERLGGVLRNEINRMQTSSSGNWHSKWQQVDLDANVPGWERDFCSWNSISMVTGSKTGTYFVFGNEISDVSSGEVFLEVKNSKGSLDNVERMNGFENAAIGIVQSDVISWLKASRSINDKEMAKNLRLMTPLYNEELHLIANKNIKNIKDLDGKIVSAGRDGSGTFMTARILSGALGIKPNFVNQPQGQAFQNLKNGRVDAMLFVGGKPIPFFQRLNDRFKRFPNDFRNIHIVPITLRDIPPGLPYVESDFSPAEYQWIDNKIPTIAIKSLLVSRDFSSKKDKYYKRRCQQINNIYYSLKSNISVLKRNSTLNKNNSNRTHEKWQQVNLGGVLQGWELDKCAHAPFTQNFPRPNKPGCEKYLDPAYVQKYPNKHYLEYTSCILS